MLRLKPILLFCAAFCVGAALVMYVVLTSPTLGTIWLLSIPFVGTTLGFLAILIRQMSPLWHGVSFVLFVVGCFIFYSTQKDLAASKNPHTSPDKLEKIFEAFHPYQKNQILNQLAANPSTPKRVLNELGTLLMKIKPSASRHWGLAANPHIETQMIEYLIHIQPNDFDKPEDWQLYKSNVLKVLLQNPALSEEQAQKAASHLEAAP